ncbi:MAG: exodeoxyribonuclease VII large subunit [Phycisphaerae bacterium]
MSERKTPSSRPARNSAGSGPSRLGAQGADRNVDAGQDVTALFLGPSAAPMSITALVTQIRGALAKAFPQRICVVGEISNFKLHSSGHLYFRLKDAGAAIDAAMFRSAAARLKFRPADGMEVVAEGRVDVYDVRGQLQFYVETLTPKGAGALELAFRQLRDKLQKEGLFDPARKVAIPRFPRAVGLVTSPTGAAIRDIRRTLARRWPAAEVFLMPALVQGQGAAQSVAEAITLLDASAPALGIDTIIIARGGGSLEDLWAFNEEAVARAIFACRTPIISGVGHETDVTIADMVADVRAATPTAAAELAVPDKAAIASQVGVLAGRLTRRVGGVLADARAALGAVLRSAVFRDPRYRLRTGQQRIDELAQTLRGGLRGLLMRDRAKLEPLANRLAALHPARLKERAAGRLADVVARLRWVLGARSKRAGDVLALVAARLTAVHPRNRIALAGQQVAAAARQLEAMSYRSVLGRGFSVTRAGGKILRSVTQVNAGLAVQTELADGTFGSVADGSVDRSGGMTVDAPTTTAPHTTTLHTTAPSTTAPNGKPAMEEMEHKKRKRSTKPGEGEPRLF